MPGKNEIDKLTEEIEKLKKDLNLAYEKRKSLIHPEVVAISMQLDEKIVPYMKIKINNKPDDDLIKETVFIYSHTRCGDTIDGCYYYT